jgi:polysaccharide export outer membrane protein
MYRLLALSAGLVLGACASDGGREANLVTAARTIDPTQLMVSSRGEASGDYRIGATDLLSIRVLQVEDLSFDEIRVDAAGNIQLPLIGVVQAAGLTPGELSSDLARRLGERYLRNPQVTVSVKEAASQKVTIDGAVTQPGVFEMRGRTTLLQAVAMARGPLREANVEQVAIFREVDGQRMVAVFDLKAIRDGRAEDPLILGDDVIVVDISRLSSLFQDAVRVLPALSVFRLF